MPSGKSWGHELLKQRQVIPRWHEPTISAISGERSGPKNGRFRFDPSHISKLLARLEENDPNAEAELLETRFLKDSRLDATGQNGEPESLRSIWNRVVEFRANNIRTEPKDDLVEQTSRNLRRLRQSLKTGERQPLAWAETARNYLISGKPDKARRAMETAIGLSRSNIYLRRCAARMYLHLEDGEHALWHLRTFPSSRTSPQIICSEIAISSQIGVTSRLIQYAEGMIDDRNVVPGYRSELAAALATVEIMHGHRRKSRVLFQRSADACTENSLAQLHWAVEQDARIEVNLDACRVQQAFEAGALAARRNGDWASVMSQCQSWHLQEPFSFKAALLGSFCSIDTSLAAPAEAIATSALFANPNDPGLLNNRAVARIYLGQTDAAIDDVLCAAKSCTKELPYLFATVGLIAYRTGDFQLGNSCYALALDAFADERDRSGALLAALFWLRELANVNPDECLATLREIEPMTKRFINAGREPEIEYMLDDVGNQARRGEGFAFSYSAAHQLRLRDCIENLRMRLDSGASKSIQRRLQGIVNS